MRCIKIEERIKKDYKVVCREEKKTIRNEFIFLATCGEDGKNIDFVTLK